jgi:hypothetical protein
MTNNISWGAWVTGIATIVFAVLGAVGFGYEWPIALNAIFVIFFIVSIALFLNGWFTVEKDEVAARLPWGKMPEADEENPNDRCLDGSKLIDEGIAWALPSPLEEIEPYSKKKFDVAGETDVKCKAMSGKSAHTVTIKWKFPFAVDPVFIPAYRRWVKKDEKDPTKENRDVLMNELTAEINSHLTNIGNTIGYMAFVDFKAAIELMINCSLRLKIDSVPHKHGKGKPEFGTDFVPCGTDRVELKDRPKFYFDNHGPISGYLHEEVRRGDERSEVEKRFGGDIGEFKMEKITFSATLEKAQDVAEEAEQKSKVVDQLITVANRIHNEVGVGNEESLDSAQLILGQSTKHSLAIRGNGSKPIELYTEVDGIGGRTKKEDK